MPPALQEVTHLSGNVFLNYAVFLLQSCFRIILFGGWWRGWDLHLYLCKFVEFFCFCHFVPQDFLNILERVKRIYRKKLNVFIGITPHTAQLYTYTSCPPHCNTQ